MATYYVITHDGKLKGKEAKDINGGTFFSFQGIPYAKPPVGELRFKAPQPVEKWSGSRNADKESQECYQRHMVHGTIIGSEDCLYLNVYTPTLPNIIGQRLPVMVWIHGGAFTGGSGNSDPYGPELLVAQDVILVTINYRVGLLGFLALDDTSLDVPGNAGLKDVVLALKWIQQNILCFNGNPQCVTVFGNSAGGVAVHMLMLSPLSKGLFHNAIAQSSCGLNDWAVTKNCTKELCTLMGFESDDPKEILKFLQSLSIKELYDGQEKLQLKYGISRVRPIGPVIEPEHDGAFLTKDPLQIIMEGKYYKVPLLIGYNSREGIFFDMVGKRMNQDMMIRDFETVVPKVFNLEKGSAKSLECAQEIKKFYYGDEEVSINNKDKYYQLETDVTFLRDIYRAVKIHKRTSKTALYMYRFSVDAELNFFKRIGGLNAPGASHGDEMGYLFKTPYCPSKIDVTTIEGINIYRMVKFWTNFAKHGSPNPVGSDDLIQYRWMPVEKGSLYFMDIEQNRCFVSPEENRMAFWEDLYEKYK